MGVHSLDTMAAYEEFLGKNPEEFDLLFKEMLIGVTGFFRDPAVWEDLKDALTPALRARSAEGSRLRAWVVGCSTGEEAYTLAMVFKEVVDALPAPDSYRLQIFATDLGMDAIALARKGHYPARIAEVVSTERLARFFNAEGDGFRVSTAIREMVLFAQHDVILDPPFTRLDILCCRNLLIYFNAALQQRLVPLFHYSLRPGGILVLGGSETVGQAKAMFVPLSPKSRIYRRSDVGTDAGWVDFPVNRYRSSRQSTQEPHALQGTVMIIFRDVASVSAGRARQAQVRRAYWLRAWLVLSQVPCRWPLVSMYRSVRKPTPNARTWPGRAKSWLRVPSRNTRNWRPSTSSGDWMRRWQQTLLRN
jgi:two-component system CheB/CheR fusion protein